VTELLTAGELFNEGRRMKSCLSSDAFRCASDESAIFSLERVYPISGLVKKNATLEVVPSRRTLVQAPIEMGFFMFFSRGCLRHLSRISINRL